MDFIKPLLTRAAHHRRETGRPFVTLSYAQSLDGCISARAGEALPLSGHQSLTLTHQLRAGHDAILVGIGTVLSDDPRLNVRLVDGKSPKPIVVDSRLRLPLDCKLLKQNSRHPWIVTREEPEKDRREALEASGAQVISCAAQCQGPGSSRGHAPAARGTRDQQSHGGRRVPDHNKFSSGATRRFSCLDGSPCTRGRPARRE